MVCVFRHTIYVFVLVNKELFNEMKNCCSIAFLARIAGVHCMSALVYSVPMLLIFGTVSDKPISICAALNFANLKVSLRNITNICSLTNVF